MPYAPRKCIPWYKKEPPGTPEELQEAFEVMDTYLYKILSFSERDGDVSKEEVDKERRIFSFLNQGPRAGYLRMNPRGKLTSCDVLHILTSTSPSGIIARNYDLDDRKVRRLRAGELPEWKWEYDLIKRIKAIVRGKLLSDHRPHSQKICYIIYKVHSEERKELMYITSSKRKAVQLREDMLNKGEYKDLVKKGILDIIYPIEKESML